MKNRRPHLSPAAKIFTVFLLLFSVITEAGLPPYFATAEEYADQFKLCQGLKTQNSDLRVIWATARESYQDVNSREFSLFGRWRNSFDPKRPTVLVFNGGPGARADEETFPENLNFNILLFDQRGVGCSLPNSYETWRSASFNKSQWIAEDANALIDHLKIPIVSVYGHSFGTIPATQFAHFFPNHTTSLVLEGVIADGTRQILESPHRKKLLDQVIQSFPAESWKKIEAHLNHNGDPNTFSDLGRAYLMYNNGIEMLKNALAILVETPLPPGATENLPQEFNNQVWENSDTTFGAMVCLEMSGMDEDVADYYTLKNGQLSLSDKGRFKRTYCDPLGLNKTMVNTYHSKDFTVKVPVTYFHGSDDSATDAVNLTKHYRNVPTEFRQMLILVRGGHVPNQMLLDQFEEQVAIFTKALLGKQITEQDLKLINGKSDLKWVYSSNDGNPKP